MLVIMQNVIKSGLTFKNCVNIVQCLNISLYKSPHHAVLSRKLYQKLVEHDLVDDCCFDFHVSKFFHLPYTYSIEL